jgi:hypothetical protein
MITRDMELLGELATELLIGDVFGEQPERRVQPP